MNKYRDGEFHRIIKHITANCNFDETKNVRHHGITRYDHSKRKAKWTYKISKLLNMKNLYHSVEKTKEEVKKPEDKPKTGIEVGDIELGQGRSTNDPEKGEGR